MLLINFATIVGKHVFVVLYKLGSFVVDTKICFFLKGLGKLSGSKLASGFEIDSLKWSMQKYGIGQPNEINVSCLKLNLSDSIVLETNCIRFHTMPSLTSSAYSRWSWWHVPAIADDHVSTNSYGQNDNKPKTTIWHKCKTCFSEMLW